MVALRKCCFLSGLVALLATISEADWSYEPPVMPTNSHTHTSGVWNDTIFVLGGVPQASRILAWKTNTTDWVNLGDDILSVDIWANSQSFTQQESLLYVIEDNSWIGFYNMQDRQYTATWQSIPVAVQNSACLASTSTRLYVSGGWKYSSIAVLQVLDLASFEWVLDAPSMIKERSSHSCIVHNGYLWQFGAYIHPSFYEDSNERIALDDIDLKDDSLWDLIDFRAEGNMGSRAFAYGEEIYVVGGERLTSGLASEPVSDVIMFDGDTGDIISANTWGLLYSVSRHGVAMVHNKVYLIGGVGTTAARVTTISNIITTGNPTLKPTGYPTVTTETPSGAPTAAPSTSPTSAPTNSPVTTTPRPSVSPTLQPTAGPGDESAVEGVAEVEEGPDYGTLIYVVGFGLCLIFAVCCIGCAVYWYTRPFDAKAKTNEQMMAQPHEGQY